MKWAYLKWKQTTFTTSFILAVTKKTWNMDLINLIKIHGKHKPDYDLEKRKQGEN